MRKFFKLLIAILNQSQIIANNEQLQMELSDLKQIGDIGNAPVFLYKKDGVNLIQSASKDEIYSLIYSLTN